MSPDRESLVRIFSYYRDAEIRGAQAGIEELRLLKGLPDRIATTAQVSSGKTRREY